jgi:hypothetical protein
MSYENLTPSRSRADTSSSVMAQPPHSLLMGIDDDPAALDVRMCNKSLVSRGSLVQAEPRVLTGVRDDGANEFGICRCQFLGVSE